MLRQLWQNLSKKPAPRTSARRARPLALEALEDRCVPAAYTWIGPDGGLWSNPANWTGGPVGTVPTAGSSVTYNTPTSSTDDLNIPAPGLSSLLIGTSAGTLDITGSLQQAPGDFIEQEGGTVNVIGQLYNGGGYNQFIGTVNVSGLLQNEDGYALYQGSLIGTGQFLNQGNNGQAGFLISTPNGANIGVTVNNYDVIQWSSGNINLTSTLTNYSGGTINMDTPALLYGTGGYLVNNYGATITSYVNIPTNLAVGIMVPFGPNNTNYGLINDTGGGLGFQPPSQFTNEGRIEETVSNSPGDVSFLCPFQQLSSTQSNAAPTVLCHAGDQMEFTQTAVLSAGTVGVLGTVRFEAPDPTTQTSLTINPGGRLSIGNGGLAILFGPGTDAGLVDIVGGQLDLGPSPGGLVITPHGTVAAHAASTPDYLLDEPVVNAGTVTVLAGAKLLLNNPYGQIGSGVTNLNGTAGAAGQVAFQVMGNSIAIKSGTFNVSNAVVFSLNFYVEPKATLSIGAGTNTSEFSGNVTIYGRMIFADGNSVTVNFDKDLTLGSMTAGSNAGISLYLTDVINVANTTIFGYVTFDFLNVPPTPPPVPYQNLTFGTIAGFMPTVILPLNWTWMFLPGGVMQIG